MQIEQETMIYKTLNILVVASAVLALSGCLEEAGVTLHEPGEYRGGERTLDYDSEALQERFDNFRDR